MTETTGEVLEGERSGKHTRFCRCDMRWSGQWRMPQAAVDQEAYQFSLGLFYDKDHVGGGAIPIPNLLAA